MVMWDEIATEVAKEFPDVTWDKMLVDAMTTRMVGKPSSLDTIVATKSARDILSDLAAALAGSRESPQPPTWTRKCAFHPCSSPFHGAASNTSRGRELRIRSGRCGPVQLMLEHLARKMLPTN